MLNKRSRTYFKRAYAASGSPFSYFALTEGNHTSQLQDCSNTKDMTKLLNYLKTTDSKTIRKCQFAEDWGKTLKPEWVPTIEKPGTLGAFITQSPDDIYNSNDAPFMDALFSFTNQVIFNHSVIFNRTITFTFILQEQILFDASLINYTEPLITENWNESTVRLPFDDFNATTYPNVITNFLFLLLFCTIKIEYFAIFFFNFPILAIQNSYAKIKTSILLECKHNG